MDRIPETKTSRVDGDIRYNGHLEIPKLLSETRCPNDKVRWCVKYLKPRIDNSLTESFRNSICLPLVGTQNRVLEIIETINKRADSSSTKQDERAAVCATRVACSSVDRTNLAKKLNVHNRVELVSVANRRGLIIMPKAGEL